MPANVEHWDDERSIGKSLIVTLKSGWRFDGSMPPEHVQGFDSVREAQAATKRAVPCQCGECTRK